MALRRGGESHGQRRDPTPARAVAHPQRRRGLVQPAERAVLPTRAPVRAPRWPARHEAGWDREEPQRQHLAERRLYLPPGRGELVVNDLGRLLLPGPGPGDRPHRGPFADGRGGPGGRGHQHPGVRQPPAHQGGGHLRAGRAAHAGRAAAPHGGRARRPQQQQRGPGRILLVPEGRRVLSLHRADHLARAPEVPRRVRRERQPAAVRTEVHAARRHPEHRRLAGPGGGRHDRGR